MKRLLTLLTAILITITLTQSLSAQGDVLDPASPAFQAELQDLQLANPQLGPDHNLVFPGDTIVFVDGTTHIIQQGENESMLLLEYLQEQQLTASQVVAIIRAGQPNIMISQAVDDSLPWLTIIPLWAIAGAIVLGVVFFGEIRDAIRNGGVDITNNYRNHQHDHFHPQPQQGKENEEPSELDSFFASIFFGDLVAEIKKKQATKKEAEDSAKYQNLGHVVRVFGTGNTVNIHPGSSQEVSKTSETESKT